MLGHIRSIWGYSAIRTAILLSGLAVLNAACGGAASTESSTTSTAAPVSTTSTTSTTTTTTTLPPTTTTTAPPTPEELRAEFLADLDAEGWKTFTDSVIGWSVRYPADWEVVIENPGRSVALATQDGGVLFMSALQDASEEDTGSAMYLEGNVQFGVDEGQLNPPAEDRWFWLDRDFDAEEGLLDIAGVITSFAVDPLTGDAVPEGSIAPTWWYGYYDPGSRPDYGYVFQTIGTDPVLLEAVDTVILSFDAPGHEPTTSGASEGADERWLTSVRGVEGLIVLSGGDWVPWTVEFSDQELLTMQSEWCSEAEATGDIGTENSPRWLFDHPVASSIEEFLDERDANSVEQLSYSVEVMLVMMLRHDLCGHLQPSFDRADLLDHVSGQALAVITDSLVVLSSEPEGELFENIVNGVFGTCTNIDNSTPEAIFELLIDHVFEADDEATQRLVMATMLTSASYVCPGLSQGPISDWANDGFPTG